MIRRLGVFLLTIVALLLGVKTVCQAQSRPLLTHHVREVTLNGQAPLVGLLPATQSMRIDIVLALRDQPELENFLQKLYDPSSPVYRRFLTVPEFTAKFGPSQEDYEAVIRFATTNGFTVVGGSRDAMDVQLKGSVGTVETAFHITMGVYQHPTENRTFYAPDREPAVDLPFQLWHISGLDNYSIPRPLYKRRNPNVTSNATTGSCPGESFCGSDMRAAYYAGTALTGSGENIGLLEYAGFDIADVNTYYQNAGQTRTFAVTGISTDGSSLSCVYPSCDDTEQTIDITQAGGMAPGVTTVYVYVSDSSDTALLGAMSSDAPLPLNLSSSWTWGPPDPSTDDPYFEKMAAQGQSFFQAAGDGGAYEGSAPWPPNSQYVIAVGGTDLETTGPAGPWASETAWVDGGGGWGTNVPIPSWQQLPGVITAANEGSTTYRNVPDVSANSNFTFYVCADQQACTANNYGGTSFAAPMWAGYLALANQQAAANGDSPVGFIDPTIYAIGVSSSYDTDFHDITSGSNGLPTTVGYDLATGWGSPNAANLINALAPMSTTPSFSIAASPSSQTVVQGTSTAYTVTVAPLNGYDNTVSLTVSGCPTGGTCAMNPTSSGPPSYPSSTLTVTTSSSTPGGNYLLTVTGSDGTLTHTTAVTLVVVVPDFSISASPSSQTVKEGSTASYKVTLTPVNTFSGSVTLTDTGCPQGGTCLFSPNPVTVTSPSASTSTFTVATGKKGTATHTITITASSGSLKHSITVNLVIAKR